MQDNLINQFIRNLQLAGGEVLEEIPDDYYVTSAHFGVAENGAVFVENYTKELFLSEEVAVILNKSEIYEKIADIIDSIENPGVFISGPSKTADVESFLVFGAHGPMKLGIYFK
jgi:L-lactate dehydrogenase complex protein LldG